MEKNEIEKFWETPTPPISFPYKERVKDELCWFERLPFLVHFEGNVEYTDFLVRDNSKNYDFENEKNKEKA
jgi:hypothetical protein